MGLKLTPKKKIQGVAVRIHRDIYKRATILAKRYGYTRGEILGMAFDQVWPATKREQQGAN